MHVEYNVHSCISGQRHEALRSRCVPFAVVKPTNVSGQRPHSGDIDRL